MNKPTPPTIDGKPGLLRYAEHINPAAEIPIDELQPHQSWALPPGFTATDNPQSLSIQLNDPLRTRLFGPFSDLGVSLRVIERNGRAFVKGLDLLAALAQLAQVGPPIWQRDLHFLAGWWKRQIAGCADFQAVPEGLPEDREGLLAFIERTPQLEPVYKAFVDAVDAGATSLTKDSALRDMIERGLRDPVAAVNHYRALAAAMRPASPPPRTKRTARPVPSAAEVVTT